jgi:hypothetical protein
VARECETRAWRPRARSDRATSTAGKSRFEQRNDAGHLHAGARRLRSWLQYHRIVSRRSGVLVAALTIWLGAGPLVLDQCLVGCHEDSTTASSSSAPVCHDAAGDTSDALWQATVLCHHDHATSVSETIAKSAPESPLKAVSAALVSQSAPVWSARAVVSATPPSGGAAAAAFLRPLRL